jgi:hypothetical protein
MVSWFRSLFSSTARVQLAPDAIPVPWTAGRTAILDCISACELQGDGSLPDSSFAWPDQQPHPSGIRLADGHADDGLAYELSALERAQVHDLSTALRRAADDHAAPRLARLYQVMLSAANARCSEALLERLGKSGADPARMALLARWLARKAPDAIAVKFAIAMLGRYGSAEDADVLMTLGLHEDFTLASALALCKLLPPEQSQTAMWNLARRVRGWGRIHVVRRLARSGCPEIEQWLLRDGYKNSHMKSCLAYLCATGGNLLGALQAPVADDRLLVGAGEIIQGMLDGYDAVYETMVHYADGAAATLAYLQRVQRQRPQQLQVAAAVIDIADMGNYGWDENHARHARHLARQILAQDYWPVLVVDKLQSGSDDEFELAATVAPAFRVDPWEFQFAKQQRRERSQWFGLTDTTDPKRVERYLALALDQLDLAALDRETHAAINWLAIGLRKFPGKGWPILRAALAGGDWANKSNALDTLAKWRPAHWNAEAVAVLEHAWRTETHVDLKRQMDELLQRIPAAHARERSGT